jgi:hypothetical protein
VNRAAYDRIEEGMTLAEVEQILGGPQGGYATRNRDITYVNWLPAYPDKVEEGLERKFWWGDRLGVAVDFGEDGHARHKKLTEFDPPTSRGSLFSRVRARLGM